MLRRLLVACALSLSLAQPAGAAWSEAKSRHFIIYSEQRPAELQQFAGELERFDQVARRHLKLADPVLSDNGKLVIYVLRSGAAIESLARRPNVRGFYIIRPWGVRAFVNRDPQLSPWSLSGKTVFFHEYLHHLMLENTDAALPGWFVEGAAEFFSTANILKDGSVQIGAPPLHRATGLFLLSGLSVEELVGADTTLSGEERELLYGRGWLLYHMLSFDPARQGQRERYLAEIQKGVAPLDAARTAFGDLRILHRDMQQYLGRRRISAITTAAAAINPGPVTVRALTPGHSAVLPLVFRTERGLRPADHAAALTEARRLAQRYPDDPAVLAAQADVEQIAGNDAAAVAAADKALAREPQSSKALVIRARAMLAAGSKAPATTNWREVQAAISQANRRDPEHAEPLVLFYRSFLAQRTRPTANAVAGLAYAQVLMPQVPATRMLLVRQYIRDRKFAEAAALYGPIAYDPHAGNSRERRLQLMAALKTGAAAQAGSLAEGFDDDGDEPRGGKPR